MTFLKLMYITNRKDIAQIAQTYGVDRIWIDLETLGKNERQKNMNTVKSNHSINDIKIIAPLLTTSEMLVRVNPINFNSAEEINEVIKAGADIIMLPMWKSEHDVRTFLEIVNKRVKTILLLETREAVNCLDDVLKSGGFDEIHIGLNDLHLSFNLRFMFELLTNGTVETICNKIKKYKIPYGFGGIARIGEGTLAAEKIIMEHYRLESTRAILSRSFCNVDEISNIHEVEESFKKNMSKLLNYERSIENTPTEILLKNKENIVNIVNEIVKELR